MGVPRLLSASEGASVSLEKTHPYVALDRVSSMSLIRGGQTVLISVAFRQESRAPH